MPTISIPTNYLVSMNKKYSLFCLPSAGSSASMYSLWSKYATDWLSVYQTVYIIYQRLIAPCPMPWVFNWVYGKPIRCIF